VTFEVCGGPRSSDSKGVSFDAEKFVREMPRDELLRYTNDPRLSQVLERGHETQSQWATHEEWCAECLTIPDKQGQVVPLIASPAQQRLFEAVRRQRKKRRPVRIIYLKPRQVHLSVGATSHLFREVPFQDHQHSLLISHSKDSAERIFGYIDHFRQAYRGTLQLPAPKSMSPKTGFEWKNGSYIKMGTAKTYEIGRSPSFRHLQLDEFAFWANASRLMTGLLPAVPDDPETSIFIISTANGVGGCFHQLWQEACDRSQESIWLPVSFFWWEHPEYVRPLEEPPDKFQRSLHRDHPWYGDELAERERYTLSLEQLNWRRWKIRELDHSLDKFNQEFPSSAGVAFLTSGRLRFDPHPLSRMPIIQDGLAGGIEVRRSGTRERTVFMARERGEVVIYSQPQRHGVYVIGADPSEGIDVREGTAGNTDPDYSAACVLDARTGEQVAKFRARYQPAAFGAYLYDFGMFYNCAYLVPEAKGSALGTVEKLIELEYPLDRLHRRRGKADVVGQPLLQNYGYDTNTVTRPQLISALDDAIREEAVKIRDPNTLQECRTFIYKPSGKAEHADECHDDEVFALALAVIGLRFCPWREKARSPVARPAGVVRYGRKRYKDEDDD
jgi:hypothetical protein